MEKNKMLRFTEKQWQRFQSGKLQFVSKGSQGEVYKTNILNKDVAIKQFKNPQDFIKEVECLNNCSCDYVVQIFGITSTPEALFLDYYPYDLEDFFDKQYHQIQNENRIIEIVHDIIYAVTYIHRVGYIHLDIRPKNFLLNHDRCVICDFGLAIEDKEPYNHNRGIDMWVTPEIVRGQVVSKKTDIYSLALVLWYVVVKGQYTPFEVSATPDMIRTALMSKDRPLISRRLFGLEEQIMDFVKLMWVDDQNARPSAEEVKVFIDNIMK